MASPAAEPAHKDRSTWLVVFGIFEGLLGLAMLGFIALLVFTAAIAPQSQANSARANFLQTAVIYLGFAVFAFLLAAGSIWPRRWARALTVAYCCFWLVIGVVAILFTSIFLPRMMRQMPASPQPGAEGAQIFAVVFVVFFMTMVFVVIPAVFLLFYSSRNVKATFEARDPTPRWTDRCPMPVLILGLVKAMGVVGLVATALGAVAAVPVFGFILSGPAARVTYLLMAPLWGVVAWGLLTMRKAGWWGAFALTLFFWLSSLITFARVDVLEFYRRGGMPEEQLRIMASSGFLQPMVQWMMPAFFVVYLAYVVFLRRYFYRAASASA